MASACSKSRTICHVLPGFDRRRRSSLRRCRNPRRRSHAGVAGRTRRADGDRGSSGSCDERASRARHDFPNRVNDEAADQRRTVTASGRGNRALPAPPTRPRRLATDRRHVARRYGSRGGSSAAASATTHVRRSFRGRKPRLQNRDRRSIQRPIGDPHSRVSHSLP